MFAEATLVGFAGNDVGSKVGDPGACESTVHVTEPGVTAESGVGLPRSSTDHTRALYCAGPLTPLSVRLLYIFAPDDGAGVLPDPVQSTGPSTTMLSRTSS